MCVLESLGCSSPYSSFLSCPHTSERVKSSVLIFWATRCLCCCRIGTTHMPIWPHDTHMRARTHTHTISIAVLAMHKNVSEVNAATYCEKERMSKCFVRQTPQTCSRKQVWSPGGMLPFTHISGISREGW